MARISTFISGMIAGATLYFVITHYHFVRSDDGFFVVPKITQNLQDSYVDIREFGLSDWQSHRMLAASILGSEHKQILEHSSLTGFRKTVIELTNDLLGTK